MSINSLNPNPPRTFHDNSSVHQSPFPLLRFESALANNRLMERRITKNSDDNTSTFAGKSPKRNAAGSYSYHLVEMFKNPDAENLHFFNNKSVPRDRHMSPGVSGHTSGSNWRQSNTMRQSMMDQRNLNSTKNYAAEHNDTESNAENAGNQTSLNSHQNQGRLSRTNLYIKGLAPETSDEDLMDMCKEYGNVMSTKAIMDKATNSCKGYGFVDFDGAEAAEKAVEELRNKGVQAQMAKQQEQDPSNLYLANLPSFWTEADLDALLSPYGTVISTRVLKTPLGASRGVGFARMESRDACETIMAAFNGKPLAGVSSNPLLVKYADTARKNKKGGQNTNLSDGYGFHGYEHVYPNPPPYEMNVMQNQHFLAACPRPSTNGLSVSDYSRNGPFNPAQFGYVPMGAPNAFSHSAALLSNFVPPYYNAALFGYPADSASGLGSLAQQFGHLSLAGQPHGSTFAGHLNHGPAIAGTLPSHGSVTHQQQLAQTTHYHFIE